MISVYDFGNVDIDKCMKEIIILTTIDSSLVHNIFANTICLIKASIIKP